MSTLKSVPSTKEIRYDRQLRLWGDAGQTQLERAHVCLLNATALGSEILKSLVLPGIAQFTIFDKNVVEEADLGKNFFVTKDSVGLSRAQVVCELLKELNSDVKGEYQVEAPAELLTNDLSILDQFTIVIGTNLNEKTALDFSDYLWGLQIPFIHARCYGLTGYLRICKAEHPVVDTHPENARPDLRLDKPFPSLANLAKNTNLDEMSHQEHSHTPYLLLLIKGLEKWRSERNDEWSFPSSYAERKEFRSLLLRMRRPDDKGRLDEENFQEALDSLTKALQPTLIPESVKTLLEDEKCRNLTEESSKFWILCNSLGEFIKENGSLPLSGTLPDMTSDSARYVQLSTAFRDQATADAESVFERVQSALGRLGLPTDSISSRETAHFCKNAAHLTLVRGSTLRSELSSPCPGIIGDLEAYDPTCLSEDCPIPQIPPSIWYVLLRCCDRFETTKLRYPGTTGVPCELDKHDLWTRVKTLFSDWKFPSFADKVADAGVEEMCRYGADEVHSVAALIGGIGAQEAIKLITSQYIPLDNTFVYDGHTGQAAAFKL